MTFFEDRSKNSCKNEKFISMIDERDKLIALQEKDIKCLKKEIFELKNELNCFLNEKE